MRTFEDLKAPLSNEEALSNMRQKIVTQADPKPRSYNEKEQGEWQGSLLPLFDELAENGECLVSFLHTQLSHVFDTEEDVYEAVCSLRSYGILEMVPNHESGNDEVVQLSCLMYPLGHPKIQALHQSSGK